MNKKLFNKRLIYVGAGTLAGLVGGTVVAGSLNQTSGFMKNYSKEIAAGSMTVAGSYLLAQSNQTMKNVGTGMGSVGVAMLVQSGYNRFLGGNLSAGNGENGESESGTSDTWTTPWGSEIPMETV